jgi:hypothetical protein
MCNPCVSVQRFFVDSFRWEGNRTARTYWLVRDREQRAQRGGYYAKGQNDIGPLIIASGWDSENIVEICRLLNEENTRRRRSAKCTADFCHKPRECCTCGGCAYCCPHGSACSPCCKP